MPIYKKNNNTRNIEGVDIFDGRTIAVEHSEAAVFLDSHPVSKKGKNDDEIEGTDGDDVLIGTDKKDEIDGEAGNDFIDGLAGKDMLKGGDGDDEIFGREGKDDIDGDSGNDILHGGKDQDDIKGGRGDDTIDGGNGDDDLKGGKGNDVIYGGSDKDDLDGGDGNDLLDGGDGKDKLKGGDGDDSLSGGRGNDDLKGEKGNDSLSGGEGDDKLGGGKGDDSLDGGAGKDELDGGDGIDSLEGGNGKDELKGGDGDDSLSGGKGRDILKGEKGNDSLIGGDGEDKLDGGKGDDLLEGGIGKDDIDGGSGDDHFIWQAGDGEDKLDGGKGNDTITITTSDTEQQTISFDVNNKGNLVVTIGSEELVLKDIESFNLVYGAGGVVLDVGDDAGDVFGDVPLPVTGGDSSDVIDVADSEIPVSVDAGEGDDEVTGGNADDEISGGEGSDIISGGGGDDVIDAGVGDDQVLWEAGDGNDVIDGGEGFDELDLTLDQSEPSALTVSADANGNVILTAEDGTVLTVDGVEDIVFNAGAVGTSIVIGDLTGTDIAQDTLYFVGAAGDDVFDASATDRRIDARGNDGSDQLSSGAANDYLEGGAGDDVLNPGSGSGSDVVDGGGGDDLIQLTVGDDLNSGAADDIDGGADNDQLDLTFVETTNFDLTLRVESNGDGSFRVIGDDEGSVDDETANVSNVETLRIIAGEGALNFELGDLSDTSLAANGVVFEGSADDDFFDASSAEISVDLRGGDGNNTLIGSGLGDVLEGGSDSNSLQGNGGNDLLLASSGDDILDGGTGFDVVSYENASSAITLDLNIVGAQDTGSSGMDSFSGIERIEGSNFNDTIIGNNSGNVLLGGEGNDVLTGGTGRDFLLGGPGDDSLSDPDVNDPLSGGAGNDTIDGLPSYFIDPAGAIVNFSDSSVTVNSETVAARSARDGFGDTDTFSSTTESLQGSAYADHVTGSEAVNGWFLRGGDDEAYGMDGDDLFLGGSGDDYIDGGAGIDRVIYLEDGFDDQGSPSQGVIVNLANEEATDGFGDTDTLINIEAVGGSALDDDITGDEFANTLIGNAGDDSLDGAAGQDILQGGKGDDLLTGGLDGDTFEFTANDDFGIPVFGTDTITDFDTAEDILDFTPFDSLSNLSDVQAIASDDGSDTTISIPNAGSIVLQGVVVANLLASNFTFANPTGGAIVGTENDDNLDGTSGDDVIQGLGGNDILRGLAGDDQLEGGAGDDRLRGLDGSDFLVGGDDFDAADYSEDPAGVSINLALQNAVDGWGNDDFFSEVENAYGSDFNDIIEGSGSSNFVWAGDGDDIINGNGGNDELFGDGGDDIITAGPASGGLVWLHGGDGNDFLTGSSSGGGIEILLGGAGDDTLSDTAGIFSVLNGGEGNDHINGFASYLGGPAGVIINYSDSVWNIAGEVVQSRTAIDSWGDIDTFGPAAIRARSTDHDDYVQGSSAGQRIDTLAGDDEIHALGGDDRIFGGAGSDTIYGGDGWDSLSYRVTSSANGEATHGVIVNLGASDFSYGSEVPGITAGTALANTAIDQWDDPLGIRGIDSVFEIESVDGTAFGDVIIGGDEHNFLEGRDGDDQLYGGDVEGDNLVGGPGNDYLDGQGGDYDTAWYRIWDGSGGGVIVDLANNITTEDGFGGQDTLVSIENVEGSDYNDDITGDSGRNFLRGNNGDDVISAGAGDDGVNGDSGNDTIDGGAGNDFIDASPGSDITDGGDDWDIYNFGANVGTTQRAVVDLGATPDAQGFVTVSENGFGGTGLLKNFEGLWGTDHNDEFTGDANDNELQGFVGADILLGGAGNDRLEGGDDNDVLEGGIGNDQLDGGENNDILRGGAGSDQFRFIRKMYDGSLVSFGEDVVEDFDINEDILDLYNIPEITGMDALQFYSQDVGSNVVISFDSNDLGQTETNSITLWNISKSDFENMEIWFGAIQGTEGDDTIDGTNFGERIQGLGGNDIINGLDGDDRIEGDDGNDQLYGGAGRNDYVDGNGDDQIFGGPDSEFINASPGNDVFDGGDDWDTVSYRWWHEPSSGINVDLSLASNQVIDDGWGGSDTLINIESLNGSTNDDTLSGSSGDDNFGGEAGNDTINAGAGNDYVRGDDGQDTLDGGADWDVLAYPSWTDINQGINVDLENNIATNDGFGNIDYIFNFERVDGSRFDDIIRGDSLDNDLVGNEGNDVITPLGGNDIVRGGSGNDTFVYADSDGSLQFDTIDDFEPGADQIDLQGVASIVSFTDVENAAIEVGTQLEIDLGNGNTLELRNIGIADLAAGDFIF